MKINKTMGCVIIVLFFIMVITVAIIAEVK